MTILVLLKFLLETYLKFKCDSYYAKSTLKNLNWCDWVIMPTKNTTCNRYLHFDTVPCFTELTTTTIFTTHSIFQDSPPSFEPPARHLWHFCRFFSFWVEDSNDHARVFCSFSNNFLRTEDADIYHPRNNTPPSNLETSHKFVVK